ncbi:hypothetical protein ACSSS7_003185 [Eimeria intestinalis]
MALRAANELSELALVSSAASPAESAASTELRASNTDGEKQSPVRGVRRENLNVSLFKTLFAVTIAFSLAAYLISRCFQRVSLGGLTRETAPRALAGWDYKEEPCSDLPGNGGDVPAGETDIAAAERGATQAPLVTGGVQQDQQRSRFTAHSAFGLVVPLLPSPASSDSHGPIEASSANAFAGVQHATLPGALLLASSAHVQAPQQRVRCGPTTNTANPPLFHMLPQTLQQPDVPQQGVSSTAAWSPSHARPTTEQQTLKLPISAKWDGPDEQGWGHRELPRRYITLNSRALKEMDAVAVTCIVLTPLLDARIAVSLAVQVTSMAALELAALAYCPDQLQPQRGQVCDSYSALLTAITAGGGTLQAAEEMGVLAEVESLARLIKEIRTPPPKTEEIPLEQYKIKFITQIRVGWYAFGAAKGLLDSLSPWKREMRRPTLKPENVVIACRALYEILRERLKATATLRDWLFRSQEMANSHVIFSREEYKELAFTRLQKMSHAFKAIQSAVEQAGCSPDFLPAVEAASKGTAPAPSDAAKVPRSPRQSSADLLSPPSQPPQVYHFAPTVLHERSSLPQPSPLIEWPPQLPQERLPHASQSLLTEAGLSYMGTHPPPAQPPGLSESPYIAGSASVDYPLEREDSRPGEALRHPLTPSPVLTPLTSSRVPQHFLSALPTQMPFPPRAAEALASSAKSQLLLAKVQDQSPEGSLPVSSTSSFTPSHTHLHRPAWSLATQQQGGPHASAANPHPSLSSEGAPSLRLAGVSSSWSWSSEAHQLSARRRSEGSHPSTFEGSSSPSHFRQHEAPRLLAPEEQRGPQPHTRRPSLSSKDARFTRLPGVSWSSQAHQPSIRPRSNCSHLSPSERPFSPSRFPMRGAVGPPAPQEQGGPYAHVQHPSLNSAVARSLPVPGAFSSWSGSPEAHQLGTWPRSHHSQPPASEDPFTPPRSSLQKTESLLALQEQGGPHAHVQHLLASEGALPLPLPGVSWSSEGHQLSTRPRSENLHISPSEGASTPSHFHPQAEATSLAPQRQAGPHPHVEHPLLSSEGAPSLRLPGVSSIWSWSSEGHQLSTGARPEAFSSQLVAQGGASAQLPPRFWGNAPPRPEAARTGGHSVLSEGMSLSALQSSLMSWSIKADEDDE